MIRLDVKALSAHWSLPGAYEALTVRESTEHPSPSTIPGFLESLCGDLFGTFQGEFAYGQVRPPLGHGKILRSDHLGNKSRPTYWEIFFDVHYQIAVRGPYERSIREALEGRRTRFGILTLGTSDDEVYHLTESHREADWIVPGHNFPLIVFAPSGYADRTTVFGRFDCERSDDVPEQGWFKPHPRRKKGGGTGCSSLSGPLATR